MKKYVSKAKPNEVVDGSLLAKCYAECIRRGAIDPLNTEFKDYLIGFIPVESAVFVATAYWDSDGSDVIIGIARSFEKAKMIVEEYAKESDAVVVWKEEWRGAGPADCTYYIEPWGVEG